ncbi:Multidrug resistance protein MdtK [Pseudobythopirellula maris]|uniref:Multidrug-efflux transporter n=1 Tax=Pseudobythopirellula maris TaxID=2527991 RepID=A0A5C5ZNA0_9BACT|nr:MATE family efflux transporter [Pseudobythopirellula maris]TWT88994.1 Multidrug resistance protein MdtK [Pseudobythopirellula maris]
MPHDADSPHESDRAPGGPLARWLAGPGGGGEVLRVAAPLVVSSLSWTVMTFVDRLMLRNASGDTMFAAFEASTAWFTTLCLPLGLCMYASTFVSQYHGAGQPRRIGPSVWQGVWLALAWTPLLLALVPLAPRMFSLAGHGAEVVPLEIDYFRVLSWGGPALLAGAAMQSFYSGRGKTVVLMVVDTLAALLNVLLDYLWIFGHWGFEAGGIEGAGWATVVSLWIKALVYAALMLQRKHRADFETGNWLPDRELIGRLLKYGGPSGLQLLLEVGGFTTFIIMVGRLGVVEGEATGMAFSVSTLAFMPVWGLSMAGSILVGQHLGENRDRTAARAVWTTLHVAFIYMAFVSTLYVATPGLFLAGFFGLSPLSVDPATLDGHDAAVWAASVVLLRFVAAYNLLDAFLMVFVNALKGAGDTRYILLVSLVMASLLSVMSYLAVAIWEFSLMGCWAIITAWVFITGVVYLLRFLQGNWRTMRVIEQAPVLENGAAS